MKRILFATAAIVVATAATGASAQTWWNGPEVGIQGGYAWGTSSGLLTDTNPPRISARFPYSFDVNGPLGGAHVGYNWQWDQLVLGAEGDAEFADVTGSVVGPAPGNVIHINSRMDFDASVRAKLGWAFDRVLVYGTGGVAFGDVKTKYFDTSLGPIGSSDGVRIGWTAGGGIAYAITPNWEFGVEYRYTDLGQEKMHHVFNSDNIFNDNNDFKFSAVRAVLSYRFAPPPPPPPMAAPMPAAAPAPAPAMARTFLVFFDFDKYNLTPDARRVIEAAAQSYKATGSARIDVSGYTDLAGTQAYNLRLSQRRADAVAAYLIKQGVPKNVLDVKWFGKEHPRVPTPDGVREPQNRRVEIVMP